jgi:hypothetical protein
MAFDLCPVFVVFQKRSVQLRILAALMKLCNFNAGSRQIGLKWRFGLLLSQGRPDASLASIGAA